MQRQFSYNFAIPGFLAFLIINYGLTYFNPALTEIQDGIYGIASWNGTDIGARKGLFQKSILVIFLVSILWYLIISKTKILSKYDEFIADLSYLSLAGIGLLFFKLIQVSVNHSLNFLFAVIGLNLLWHISNRFRLMNIKAIHFVDLVCSCLVVTLLFKILFGPVLPTFNDLFLMIGLLGLIIVYVYNQTRFPKIPPAFFQMRYSTAAVILLALEISQICSHRGLEWSPWIWIFILAAIILPWIYFRGPKYIGYVALSLSFYLFFHYFRIYDQPEDMFELANPANSYMRFFKYNEWPFIDFLSSHLLSEQIPSYTHGILYGYDGGLDFMRYNEFFKYSIFAAASYMFLRKLLRNDWYPVFIILFFPLTGILTATSFTIALLSPLLLWKVSEKWSLVHLIMVITFSIFLLFWKIDVGIANLAGCLVILVLILLKSFRKDRLFSLIKISGGTLIILLSLFVVIEALTSSSLWNHLQQTLAYFSADQAHGLTQLAPRIDRFYFIHFFILPVTIATTLVWAGYRFYTTQKKSFLLLSLIFCCLFYLVNFQRGLIRHSLLSGSDSIMSSFSYLILTLTVLYFINRKHWNVSILAVSTLFIFLLKYDQIRKPGIFEKAYSLSEKSHINFRSKAILNLHWEKERVGQLDQFMNAHFDKDATFLDLTNHPMLYYYTQRKVPSYFNQYLQNTATTQLQKWNLEDIQEEDIPVVVYSSIPPTWLDKTDLVPNTLRYSYITNKIHKDYRPYKRFKNREIWLRNDLHGISNDTITMEKSIAFDYKENHLKWLPRLLAQSPTSAYDLGRVRFELSNPKSVREAYINIIQNGNILAKMKFFIEPETSSYSIPLDWIYAWKKTNPSEFEVYIDNRKVDINSYEVSY